MNVVKCGSNPGGANLGQSQNDPEIGKTFCNIDVAWVCARDFSE
jgi:hypothetical protein